MLLTHALPPSFLLPAWSARQLARAVRQKQPRVNSSTNSKKNRKADATTQPAQERREPLSLFEQLFPEEAAPLPKIHETSIGKLPAFEWNYGPSTFGTGPERDKANHEARLWNDRARSSKASAIKSREANLLTEKTSVLIVSALSKTLAESDFFRLSPRGEHIEGWTSGITKVIPGRDPKTLEPLGYYFILFSNEPAARAYLDNMIRQHRITRVCGSMNDPFLTANDRHLLRPGENLKQLVRGFSLVPTRGRLTLRMLAKPYTQHVENIIKLGATPILANQANKAEDMVLLWSDTARFEEYQLREALNIDGRRRNLHWRLAGKENDFVKLDGDHRMKTDDDLTGERSQNRGAWDRKYKAPARYTIAFRDRHEARRFVREWHRRPFPLGRGHSSENEEPPIINAEVLW